jgi:hypothetical protein
MENIVELGCIACRVMGFADTPAEIHHIDGKTKPNAHFLTIPLCPPHHRYGLDGEDVVSRHPHKRKFEAKYGTEDELRSRCCSLVGFDPLDWHD